MTTWRDAYISPNLANSTQLNDDYSYVYLIPAAEITDTDTYCKITANVASLWIGYAAESGNTYDFDGNQIQVTPSEAFEFTLDTTKDLLIAVDMNAGQSYLYNNSVNSSFEKFFKKTTTNDAATTDKSGYTERTGQTGLIERIEVTDEIITESPVDEEGDDYMNLMSYVDAGEIHSAGHNTGIIAGVSGEHLVFQLENPAGSGKKVQLLNVDITLDAPSHITIRSHDTNLAHSFQNTCNHKLWGGSAVANPRYDHVSTVPGSLHASRHYLTAGAKRFSAFVQVPDGKSVLIALDEGVGASVNFEWREF